MGQKIHPRASASATSTTGSRTGSTKGFADYLNEDLVIRSHIEEALARRAVRDHDREGVRRDRGRHLHGRPGIVIGKSGSEVDALRRAPQAHGQARQGEHQGDQATRARRQARRAVDRRAASEPSRLPTRDEARAHLGDALRSKGSEGPGLRPARRRRDGADRGVLRRAGPLHTLRLTSTTGSPRRGRPPAESA